MNKYTQPFHKGISTAYSRKNPVKPVQPEPLHKIDISFNSQLVIDAIDTMIRDIDAALLSSFTIRSPKRSKSMLQSKSVFDKIYSIET